jgi:hypothetical protein
MRDSGLEELVLEHIGGLAGLSEKSMFGGRTWLLDGHLLCGASDRGMLVRLGKGNDAWALALPGIEQLDGSRPYPGWVVAGAAAYADDTLRLRLLDAALAFVRSQPPKL